MTIEKNYHMTPEQFREYGRAVVDWIADYYENIEKYPVLSQAQPGQIRATLPAHPPARGEPFEKLLKDPEVYNTMNGPSEFHVIGVIKDWDIVNRLGDIHVPTLVAGELDEATRRELKRKWKNVRLVPPAQSLRRPGYLAALAWERWQKGDVDDPIGLAPIYLRTRDPIPDV